MTNVDLTNRHHKNGLQGITLHAQSLLTIYMSSKNFEKVGYGMALIKDLLTSLYYSHVSYCMRSGLVEKNNHLRANWHGVPSPKSLFNRDWYVQSPLLRAWKLGLTTSHRVPCPKCQVWHRCLYGNTFWRWGLGLVLRVGSINMENRSSTYRWTGWVEKQLVEVQEIRKLIDRFRGIHGIYFKLLKTTERSRHVTGWTWKH